MNPNKLLWEKGDFTIIAKTMRQSGTELVSTFGIQPGMKVLDLGCGDGTTAIPAALLGAHVQGVDIATNLVAAGNARIKAEQVPYCSITEGDATDLRDLGSESFDLAVSIFGAMFAPRPFDVAKELVRVVKPGGRIIMGNWIPGDPTLVAQILRISSAYTPPPPADFVSPMLWGVEEKVTERFTAAGIDAKNIRFTKTPFTFRAACSPAEFVHQFRSFYGPTMNAFEAAEKNGKADELQHELEALFESQNKSGDNSQTVVTATFLLVEATK
ncbi:MAG: class I SAM-dependent methyltransferase [Chitinophagaceae bacterium]|nr:MAG: class I SAM-dependent methyltransferase [Chitinophagaceae bacterium]